MRLFCLSGHGIIIILDFLKGKANCFDRTVLETNFYTSWKKEKDNEDYSI